MKTSKVRMSHPCFLKDFFIVYVCMSINERHTERGGEKDKEEEEEINTVFKIGDLLLKATGVSDIVAFL